MKSLLVLTGTHRLLEYTQHWKLRLCQISMTTLSNFSPLHQANQYLNQLFTSFYSFKTLFIAMEQYSKILNLTLTFFSLSVLQLLLVLRAEGLEGTRDFLDSLEGLSKLSMLFVPFFLLSLESACKCKEGKTLILFKLSSRCKYTIGIQQPMEKKVKYYIQP